MVGNGGAGDAPHNHEASQTMYLRGRQHVKYASR